MEPPKPAPAQVNEPSFSRYSPRSSPCVRARHHTPQVGRVTRCGSQTDSVTDAPGGEFQRRSHRQKLGGWRFSATLHRQPATRKLDPCFSLRARTFQRPLWAQVLAKVTSIVSAARVTARDAVTSAGRPASAPLVRASRALGAALRRMSFAQGDPNNTDRGGPLASPPAGAAASRAAALVRRTRIPTLASPHVSTPALSAGPGQGHEHRFCREGDGAGRRHISGQACPERQSKGCQRSTCALDPASRRRCPVRPLGVRWGLCAEHDLRFYACRPVRL